MNIKSCILITFLISGSNSISIPSLNGILVKLNILSEQNKDSVNPVSIKLERSIGRALLRSGGLSSDSLTQNGDVFELQLSPEHLQKIHPNLQPLQTFQISSSNVVLTYGGVASVLNEIRNNQFGNDLERKQALIQGLQRHASEQQRETKSVFQILSFSNFKSFWAGNNMVIRNAPLELVYILTAIPQVKSVAMERVFQLQVLPVAGNNKKQVVMGNDNAQSNIQKIEADKAIQEFGLKEKLKLVRVSSIDTGVLGTHEALQLNFCGNDKNDPCRDHAWFDPIGGTRSPLDDDGHGSHTMGTICGGHNGIGVAPGAKWMACKGCDPNGCSEEAINSCFQFMASPTNSEGQDPRPQCSPHVVSNSWGETIPNLGNGAVSDELDEEGFNDYLDVLTECNIFHSFAIGNFGQFEPVFDCGTTSSPGNQEVTCGVGATTDDDTLADFSSKGPSADELIKPDVCAPGNNILSSYNGNDTDYEVLSGTSMACPHVAGLAALLIASFRGQCGKNETLKVTTLREIIQSSADPLPLEPLDLFDYSDTCPLDSDPSERPNNLYGYGRVNAMSALKTLESMIKTKEIKC